MEIFSLLCSSSRSLANAHLSPTSGLCEGQKEQDVAKWTF